MAVGDIVSNIANVAIGGTLTFQPAAGEEYIIMGVGSDQWVGGPPNGMPAIVLTIFSGVIFSLIAASNNNPKLMSNFKLAINNTNYLRINNVSGAIANLSYWGIRTK